MSILNQQNLKDRAGDLESLGLNGIEFIIVRLEETADTEDTPVPSRAFLEVYFYNGNGLANILNKNPDELLQIFPISGGTRILAGSDPGQVKVTGVAEDPEKNCTKKNCLRLTVSPIGDYSTYTLTVIHEKMEEIDPHPFFSKINFKFRPGCFNIDCKPEYQVITPESEPVIDYLAKDYDSFKHTMITSMMQRVPGWSSTSEADLDQVLLELFSAGADELSDYQDRVINEAYLLTAKKRISLTRIAKLMNYFVHQGNQAHTFVVLNVKEHFTVDKIFKAFTDGIFDIKSGDTIKGPSSIIFSSIDYSKPEYTKPEFFPELNNIELYTWSGSVVGLKAGVTSADLAMKTQAGEPMPLSDVKLFENHINEHRVTLLLIQAGNLSESESQEAFKLKGKRQLVHLKRAQAMSDPATSTTTNETLLRVEWLEDLDFEICPGQLSLFHGNILPVYQGEVTQLKFKEYGTMLDKNEYYYERIPGANKMDSGGAICIIPEPILYEDTEPGGEIPTASTLRVTVKVGSEEGNWIETPELIHSTGMDNHFIIETEEDGKSIIRFGNGINGRKLPENGEVTCSYMKGSGAEGNIGRDTLCYFSQKEFPDWGKDIQTLWNPFDVNSGRNMEPPSAIVRRVPEAFKYHQRRAITLQDYVDRAEEISGVSKAFAEYQWTGSWRTVRVAIDPQGGFKLDDSLINEISKYLTAVKLLGEDFEIRPADYVPLEIEVIYCVNQDYWVEDLRYVVEQEFSTGYTPDGRPGFFNPDTWTFGQSVYRSQIIGRLESITGVDQVLELKMKRRYETESTGDFIKIEMNEILQVANDHNRPEQGFIHFIPKGGRR